MTIFKFQAEESLKLNLSNFECHFFFNMLCPLYFQINFSESSYPGYRFSLGKDTLDVLNVHELEAGYLHFFANIQSNKTWHLLEISKIFM